jgi:cyanate lyase
MLGLIIRGVRRGRGRGRGRAIPAVVAAVLIIMIDSAVTTATATITPNNNPSSSSSSSSRSYSSINTTNIANRVERVLAVKTNSKLTYDDIAIKLGVTNTYAAQLLLGQAKLTAKTAIKLKEILPNILNDDIISMQNEYPMRSFYDELLKEPNVYRTYEALMHNGEAIKSIINEQCGDGIMSAIDFYCDVGTTTGIHGEKRIVITLNGKFLPFIEQSMENNSAKSPRD